MVSAGRLQACSLRPSRKARWETGWHARRQASGRPLHQVLQVDATRLGTSDVSAGFLPCLPGNGGKPGGKPSAHIRAFRAITAGNLGPCWPHLPKAHLAGRWSSDSTGRERASFRNLHTLESQQRPNEAPRCCGGDALPTGVALDERALCMIEHSRTPEQHSEFQQPES